MSTTRTRILEQALALLNAQGYQAVTTRQVAQAVGISQGNLCYHFPHKQDLIMALYQQLAHEFDQTFAAISPLAHPADLFRHVWRLCYVQYRYKFLMHQFVAIMRDFPVIQADFRALMDTRRAQFERMFQGFQALGWLRPEFGAPERERFLWQNYILGDGWMGDLDILHPGSDTDKLLLATDLLVSMIEPWLTPVGAAALAQGRTVFYQEQNVTQQA
jgi:AcrR family transcriptional regulator